MRYLQQLTCLAMGYGAGLSKCDCGTHHMCRYMYSNCPKQPKVLVLRLSTQDLWLLWAAVFLTHGNILALSHLSVALMPLLA